MNVFFSVVFFTFLNDHDNRSLANHDYNGQSSAAHVCYNTGYTRFQSPLIVLHNVAFG